MDGAAVAQTAIIVENGIQVGDPVGEIRAASEGQDQELVGLVNCEVSRGISKGIGSVKNQYWNWWTSGKSLRTGGVSVYLLVEFIQGLGCRRLDFGTVTS